MSDIVATAENVLLPLGLMNGPYAIPKRIVVGAVLGAALVTFFKPSLMFTSTGVPKPWAYWNQGTDTCGVQSTWFPWYGASLLGSIILGGFI